VIHLTTRNFADIKTVTFVSLRLEVISRECLLWVSLTLRQDEMTPTERIIQSRMKEAFAFRVTVEEWATFVEAVEASESFRFEEIVEDSTIGSKARAIY